MKIFTLVFTILFAASLTMSRAQDTWIQKANFGGTAREYSVGFSIGDKGYIGTGYDYPNYFKDFWEFDPSTDAWTQKADFGGITRGYAAGFSIGSKGYMGTGYKLDGNQEVYFKDFWEYDPALNTWTQKADFGGKGSYLVAGFSIGSKGYMGTGYYYDGTSHYYKDFWEYDPALDTWTKKADFGGAIRYRAVGFSIGSKGYLGTGDKANKDFYKDFWEYDPAVNTWTQKADFGGGARSIAAGFSISGKGYLGTGYFNDGAVQLTKDFWEYDPALNTWTQKADFGGTIRQGAVGFNIGSKGYIGNGGFFSTNYSDFWEYNTGCIGLTVYTDADGDGYGDISNSLFVEDCIKPDGYVYDSADCDDANASVHPNTTENCNSIDDNCNAVIDEGCGESCAIPIGLTANNITSSSAKITWNAAANAKRYKLRIKTTGTSTWTIITNISSNSKKISGLASNSSYTCEVKSVCSPNPIVSSDWSPEQKFTTSTERIGNESMQEISFQIYPNPANDHSTIQFTLPKASHVSIKVYDVSGKEITTLLDNELQPGEHSLQLGIGHFSKGVYMLKIISDFGIENQKLIVQ